MCLGKNNWGSLVQLLRPFFVLINGFTLDRKFWLSLECHESLNVKKYFVPKGGLISESFSTLAQISKNKCKIF